jgi:leucyl aminopeptidase (aminopeptidase T)
MAPDARDPANGATLADLGRYLVHACLRPSEGERVLVRWYEGQSGLFRALALGLREAGAEVVEVARGSAWCTDRGAAELGDDWLPGPEAAYDRIVTCGPPPDVHRPEGVSAETWNQGHRLGYENLARRVAAEVPTALVDWPLRPRGRHSLGGVRRLYAAALAVDYVALAARNAALTARLDGATSVRMRCPHGTDLEVAVGGRPWMPESCNHTDGPVVYLPGGEVYSACVETSAQGQIVFNDGQHHGTAIVVDGRVTEILNSDWTVLVGHSVGELGIGTNPHAPREQLGSISEKAIGTGHLGIGSNDFLGGTTNEGIHIDLIVDDPEVSLDGEPVELSDLGAIP